MFCGSRAASTEAVVVCCCRPQVCYHCLRPLHWGSHLQLPGAAAGSRHSFCSAQCLAAAAGSYLAVERSGDWTALERHCASHGERFPLMAARLACMRASVELRRMGGGAAESLARAAGALAPPTPQPADGSSGTASGGHQAGTVAGDALNDLGALCFANVSGPPPEPWSEAHGLLLEALRPAVQQLAGAAAAEAALRDVSQLQWFVDFMSRVHLNAFKVESAVPMWCLPGAGAAAGSSLSSAAMRDITAALVSGGGDAGQSGSALYLLASMFNHSCDPNVDVTFPGDSATAAFVTNRPVAPGEALSISYMDANVKGGERQAHLRWAYGFNCRCKRCSEELAAAAAADNGGGGDGRV